MNEQSKKTVLISGGAGKMGKLIIDYLSSKDNYEIIGIYDPAYNLDDYPSVTNLDDIDPDYILEFSPASSINENIQKWSTATSNLIIGSSGISDESISLLKTFDQNRKVVVVPNFSIGAAYQKLLSTVLSKDFESVHIIEKHHKNKQDAPSGTSSDLASSLFDVSSDNVVSHDGEHHNINGLIFTLKGEKSFLLSRLLILSQNLKLFH